MQAVDGKARQSTSVTLRARREQAGSPQRARPRARLTSRRPAAMLDASLPARRGVAIPPVVKRGLVTDRSGYPRRLRIAIIVPLLPPEHHGGAELQADRMARELARRGHDVHIVARAQRGRTRHELRDGVHVHRRPVVPLPAVRLGVDVALGGMQVARLRPDVVLCYMTMNSGLVGAMAAALCGAPFVVWQRVESESLLHAPRWERRLAFAIHKRATAQWLQAESFVGSMQREYAAAGRAADWPRIAARVRVLGNGIDLPASSSLTPPPRQFLFVGRLVEQKDLGTLIDAVRAVPEAECVLVGDGPLRAGLESRARGAAVRFLGAQPHDRIPALLAASRALVLCSRWEGVPNVVLEALAHGRPVIATPVGAVADLVQDGVNGRLIPIGDAAALAGALREMLDDAAWRRLASGARASVERFSWPDLVTQVERELGALVAPLPARIEEAAIDVR